jgi:hypothetical protein
MKEWAFGAGSTGGSLFFCVYDLDKLTGLQLPRSEKALEVAEASSEGSAKVNIRYFDDKIEDCLDETEIIMGLHCLTK